MGAPAFVKDAVVYGIHLGRMGEYAAAGGMREEIMSPKREEGKETGSRAGKCLCALLREPCHC